MIGTENVSAVGTRGIYVTDRAKGTVSSYDPYTTTGRASAEGWWRFVSARPWLAGGFVWTGFDYRGEPSPYQWPNISSQYGIIDTCGFPKDTFYYYQSWWTNEAGAARVPALELAGAGRAGDRRLGPLEPGPGGAVPQRPEPRREGHAEGSAPGLEREVRSRARSRRAATRTAGR